jgi:hypothetical protein
MKRKPFTYCPRIINKCDNYGLEERCMQILEVKPDRKRPLGRSKPELQNFIEGMCQIVHKVQRKSVAWPWEI